MKKIILIGPQEDPEILTLADELWKLDCRIETWNMNLWPGPEPLSLSLQNRQLKIGVSASDTDLPSAVYVRSLALDPRHERFATAEQKISYSLLSQLQELRGLFFSSLKCFEASGTALVNPVDSLTVHSQKPWQLFAFAQRGLPIPATLVTNDPLELLAFAEQYPDLIYKPISGGALVHAFTEQDRTPERLASLANSPVLFQERILGANLRVYVLGGKVIASGEIVSSALDYRSGPHDVRAKAISPAVENAAIQASASLGLVFSAVDVMVTGEEFKILEANPAPMFAVFDEQTQSQVGKQLAHYLATGTTR